MQQMDGIRYWLETEGTGHVFFMAYPVCLLLLFFLLKGRRIRFLIPSLLMTLVIVNPLFYQLWDSLGLYAYWRILWIVPVIPVIAAVIPAIAEKCDKGWIKGIAVLAGIALIIAGGTFLYSGTGGSFTAAGSITKLPESVPAVAEKLLALKENPRIIASPEISVYIRQYTGKTDTLFGRNIYGHMDGYGTDAQMVIGELENLRSDLSRIGQYMLDNGYDYLVIGEQSHKDLIKDHFELVEQAGGYCIYRATGTARLVKERNELGQTVSGTTVDRDGKPEDCEFGYAGTWYDYDGNGNVSEIRFTDADGKTAADRYGFIAYRKKYDKRSQLITESCVSRDGAVQNRTYKSDRIVRTDYLDRNGDPAEQPAGYCSTVQEWDENGLVSRTYLNQDGFPINRTDGYARADWAGNTVRFFSLEGEPVPQEGLNLYDGGITDGEDWTEWITPKQDTVNCCIDFTSVNLGEKMAGDLYSCQIEIEFRDVAPSDSQGFFFRTQGVADGRWDVGNIWNDLILLSNAPPDGIYRYTCVKQLDEPMSQADWFGIGFRCDNWAGGSFRVRKIKIEKGPAASEWTPGI